MISPGNARPFVLLYGCLIVAGCWAGAATSVADDVLLHDDCVVRFASVAEAREVLGARDRFIQALSPFDRQSRLETDRDVSEAEFLKFVTAQVQPWPPEDRARITKVLGRIRPKLQPFRLKFPSQILLIHTTGREEGEAAYCRRNAVVLPTSKATLPPDAQERLLIHELFHILSSHDPAIRESLYRIVGFQPCTPIELPEKLRARKITNPDAPLIDSFVRLTVEDESVLATPVLFAKVDRFDTRHGGPFFRYLVFRLMEIEQIAGTWRPALDKGEPRLLVPGETPDYKRQIGENTGYIIHPDEILADNFVHLVQQTASLPSPHIVEQMRKLLGRGEG